MIQIKFEYIGIKTIVQADLSEVFSHILQKYKNIQDINLDNKYYLYNGRKVKINEIIQNIINSNDLINKQMKISAKDIDPETIVKNLNSKDILCPVCQDICQYEIKNYIIKLFGCKNGHAKENKRLNEFNDYTLKGINNKDQEINNKHSFMNQTTIILFKILVLISILVLIIFFSKKMRTDFDNKQKRKLEDSEDSEDWEDWEDSEDFQSKCTYYNGCFYECKIEYKRYQHNFVCDCCEYKIFKNNINISCKCNKIPFCSYALDYIEDFKQNITNCTCEVNKNDMKCFDKNLTLTFEKKCTCNYNFNCSGPDFLNESCTPNIINDQQSSAYIFEMLDQINNGSFKEIFKDVIETDKNYINTINAESIAGDKNNITCQISTVSSQIPNLSIVYLENVESQLKKNYFLNESEKLILFKLEHKFENFYIPIIEYQLYTKEGQKLNLSSCGQNQVIIEIPVSINEKKKFIHEPKDNYYKDKCLPYSSENGKDITLYDRKYDFNEKYLSLCEKNCEYKEYNDFNKTSTCDCKMKTEFPKLITESVNLKDLLYRFVDFKKLFSNLYVITCSKELFCSKGFKKNSGSYFNIIIISISIAFIIFFYTKGYITFKKNIALKINAKFANDKEEQQNETISDLNIIKNITNAKPHPTTNLELENSVQKNPESNKKLKKIISLNDYEYIRIF